MARKVCTYLRKTGVAESKQGTQTHRKNETIEKIGDVRLAKK